MLELLSRTCILEDVGVLSYIETQQQTLCAVSMIGNRPLVDQHQRNIKDKDVQILICYCAIGQFFNRVVTLDVNASAAFSGQCMLICRRDIQANRSGCSYLRTFVTYVSLVGLHAILLFSVARRLQKVRGLLQNAGKNSSGRNSVVLLVRQSDCCSSSAATSTYY